MTSFYTFAWCVFLHSNTTTKTNAFTFNNAFYQEKCGAESSQHEIPEQVGYGTLNFLQQILVRNLEAVNKHTLSVL